MNIIARVLKEARWIKAQESIDRMLTVIDHEDKDFVYKLKAKLSEKFGEVGKQLRAVLKPASKGQRKGLLIFVPDAPRQIAHIKDRFVQFIVRAVYDEYSVGIGKWQSFMHFNEMFNSDFVKQVILDINDRVKWLEEQKKGVDGKYKEDYERIKEKEKEFSSYPWDRRDMGSKNIFNDKSRSQKFWDTYNAFRVKVKTEHPRVPDDKLTKYISNDYTYRKDYDKIKEDFLKTIPEYIEVKKQNDEYYKKKWDEEKLIQEQIDAELAQFDWDRIKKIIQGMVDFFIKQVVQAIIKGEINFPTEAKMVA